MAILLHDRPAWGGPGIEPRWTRSDKDGVGTAYSALSRVWFTVSKGILNEVYYPTIDRPQVRDLQYLLTDGETFFTGERRLENSYACLAPGSLGFRITNSDPAGRFSIYKDVIADPHQSCLLVRTRLEGEAGLVDRLRLFALLAPHLHVGGRDNTGNVVQVDGRRVLTAHHGGVWLAMGASAPFARCSCGFVGVNDGWTDLAGNRAMDWEFNCAINGNIALTGELDLSAGREFTLAVAFGDNLRHTLVTLAQSLATPFEDHRDRFIEQWRRPSRRATPSAVEPRGDCGDLYDISRNLILAHEDKTYDGALIASLTIPWGEHSGDDQVGGYHLVWTRDMCHSVTGLLAAGNTEVPLRALIYLACT